MQALTQSFFFEFLKIWPFLDFLGQIWLNLGMLGLTSPKNGQIFKNSKKALCYSLRILNKNTSVKNQSASIKTVGLLTF